MAYEAWFDEDENKTLLAICARKLIRNIGIGGILWGLINTGLGVLYLQQNIINIGVLILGLAMLGAGIQALLDPTVSVLLTQRIVNILLLIWYAAVAVFAVFDLLLFDGVAPKCIFVPFAISVGVAGQYRKLGHLRGLIESVTPEEIAKTKEICKALLKKKLTDEPSIVQANGRKCRAQLMDGGAFFLQSDLLRAFVAPSAAVQSAVAKPDAKRWTLSFRHPLGKLKYKFDANNTEKLKGWLSGAPPAAPEPGSS